MKTLLTLTLTLLLSACASTVRVEGEQIVRDRLLVTVADAWNMVKIPGNEQPYDEWTQEGLPLDHLRLWAAVPDGKSLMKPLPKRAGDVQAPRVPTFTKGMQAEQLVSLFETLYSADGSLVSVGKVEPASFAGARGIRFEFTVINKVSDVTHSGVGWASVQNAELYAAAFMAPKLHFYSRLLPRAEAVVRSARAKG